MVGGSQGDIKERSPYPFGQVFIFVFRVYHYHVHPGHQVSQYLQFYSVAFTGTGLTEEHFIGVFQAEPVKENQGVIVLVYAVQHSLIRTQIKGCEREGRGKGTRIHGCMDHQLVCSVGGSSVKPFSLLVHGGFHIDES